MANAAKLIGTCPSAAPSHVQIPQSSPAPPPSSPRLAASTADLARAIVLRREQLRCAIAEAAYYRAERRGFVPGHELADWLTAQQEILGDRAD